jgi:pilus assembly protein CpaB
MNNNRVIVGVAVALIAGLLLSYYVYHSFQQASAVKGVATQQIVVATAPLQLGSRVTASDVKTIPWLGSSPVTGMLRKTDDAVGRAVISPVVANEMLLESKLAPRNAGAGLQSTIPEGMRAISVAVNDVVGVAGFVIPGSSVDVLVTGQIIGSNMNGTQNVTRTILEDVKVLAAGQKIEQDLNGKPQTVPVVTLLVSPKDAVLLTMASTEGKIQLALRNTIDSNTQTPDPVLQSVLFGYGPPAPAKSAPVIRRVAAPTVITAPAPYTVEIILGGKRETKNFPNQQ